MKKRQRIKLNKRFIHTHIPIGEESLISVWGVRNHNFRFMKRFTNWKINEWCEYPTVEEIQEFKRRWLR